MTCKTYKVLNLVKYKIFSKLDHFGYMGWNLNLNLLIGHYVNQLI